ncbi:helix-turn-helix domain-containing protein [Legionella nautarum]|nr:helix-turn-helix domain-containing protein [Legionella nautarum]
MDYILLGWQTSTYKLKGSTNKWFMKPYKEIAQDTDIPVSTLHRYIKELEEEGFIERRRSKYCRTKKDGEFNSTIGAYINVTDKLLAKLKTEPEISPAPAVVAPAPVNNSTNDDNRRSEQETPLEGDKQNQDRFDLKQNERIDSLILRESYIRDLYISSPINTISFGKTCSVDKPTLHRLTQAFDSVQQFLSQEVKEEVPDAIKNLVAGTFFNLIIKSRKEFSSPQQLAAEYLFALLNVDFYLPKISCLRHRNNILSKMIRDNSWRTPKGFYKHFYLGQSFKDKEDLREKRWLREKEKEMKQKAYAFETVNDERLQRVEAQMTEKNDLIDELTNSIYQHSDEDVINTIRERIRLHRKELEALWAEQRRIEQEIEAEEKRCA